MARPFKQSKKAKKKQRTANRRNQDVFKQVGKSDRSADEARKAFPMGWRVSSAGNLYFENRKNRSDKRGSNV